MSERRKPTARQVMSGTHGIIWIDGDKCYELSKYESKLGTDRESMQFAGDMIKDSKLMAVEGTWTATVRKVFSRAKPIVTNLMKGVDTRSTIIAKINDPDNGGTERVQYSNCWFDEATIQKIEQGAICEDEFSGGFTGLEYLDTVADPCSD